jgi:hypothetical protein
MLPANEQCSTTALSSTSSTNPRLCDTGFRTRGSVTLTGLGYVGDGPTLSSAWKVARPEHCRPQGTAVVCHDDTLREHAGTRSRGGSMKVPEGSTTALCSDGDVTGSLKASTSELFADVERTVLSGRILRVERRRLAASHRSPSM